MKVILLRDVAKLGKRFAVIEVPDGYALNKLIPQRLAQPATPENLKRVEARATATAGHASADATALRSALAHFAAKPLVLTAEANAQDHLFKAIKMSDIARATEQAGHPIAEAALSSATPIKALGTIEVTVKQGEVTDVLLVTITRA